MEMDTPLGNCLLIGGSGNLGTNLCEILRKTPSVSEVVIFDLRPSSGKHATNMVVGDVREKESMRGVVKDADTIYFLASAFRLTRTAKDYRDSDAVCVVGLKNIIELCKIIPREQPRRLILTSTYDTFFTGKDLRHGNEDTPRVSLVKANPYARCKLLAEKLLVEAYDKRTLLTRIAILTHLFNADDKMAKALVDSTCCGTVFTYDAAAESSIAVVENVSNGLIQMAARLTGNSAESPGAIIFADFNESLTGLYAETFRYAGQRVVSVPYCFIWIGALCMEWIYSFCVQVLRHKPWDVLYTREGVSIPMTWLTFDSTKAKEELGYGPDASWWITREEAILNVSAELKQRHHY